MRLAPSDPISPASSRACAVTPRISARAWDALTSLKLTLVCLVLLMVLVVACTLAQVNLGVLPAVNAYIRSFLVWWRAPGGAVGLPVFPGGALVGRVVAVKLVAARLSGPGAGWREEGVWAALWGGLAHVV